MQNLPSAKTYHKEVQYMPWGDLISEIADFVIENTPKGGNVLDLICGTGYLIGKIQAERPDIVFTGIDLESKYINYAKAKYPDAKLYVSDALEWDSKNKFNAVLCTGGLHHLPYNKQQRFIDKVSGHVKKGRFAIVGDPYIEDYSNEQERRVAAEKLGNEYLKATIEKKAPSDVVKAAKNLIKNDVELVEFKTSIKKIEPYFNEYFSSVEKHKTWPKEDTEYGDYYFILKN